MWLPLIICLFALALIVGPILLMQPTPTQRRLAQLREHASRLGLQVHLQAPPGKAKEAANHNRGLAAYCLPWDQSQQRFQTWCLEKKDYSHALHAAGFWHWRVGVESMDSQRLENCLGDIPENILLVSSGPQGLCAYWTEAGRTGDVESIADWLRRSAERLAAAH